MTAALLCVWLLVMNASCQVHYREDNDFYLVVDDSSQELINQDPIIRTAEVIRAKSGSNVTLACKSHSCHKKNTWTSNEWRFTPCKLCTNAETLNWTKVDTKKNCTPNLELNGVTVKHNGLYRCFVKNRNTVTFLVDVPVEPNIVKYDSEPPKLFDIIISPNLTVRQFQDVVIKYKVLSVYQPTITWFKQTERDIRYDVEYENKHYIRINQTHHVYRLPHKNGVYISKFRLQNATILNSGVYVCVAFTETGKDVRSFAIKVILNGSHYQQGNKFSVHYSVHFIIPLLFVLAPICVWLCYFRNKKVKKTRSATAARSSVIIK